MVSIKGDNDNINKYTKKQSSTSDPQRWTTIFTGVIAVATVIYAVVSSCQLTVMRRQLENSQLDQRAWVGPVEAIIPKTGERPEPHLGVKIVNSGKTPARKVLAKISTQYLSAETEFAPSYKDDPVEPSVSVIQPGMWINLFSRATLGTMTSQEMDGVRAGRNRLYLYGLITYEDIFGRPHSTRFCLYLQSDLSGFNACSTYNDAD